MLNAPESGKIISLVQLPIDIALRPSSFENLIGDRASIRRILSKYRRQHLTRDKIPLNFQLLIVLRSKEEERDFSRTRVDFWATFRVKSEEKVIQRGE